MTNSSVNPDPKIAILGPIGPAQLTCLKSWKKCGIKSHFIDTSEYPLPRALRSISDKYDHIGRINKLDKNSVSKIKTALRKSGTSNLCCVSEHISKRLREEKEHLGDEINLLINSDEVLYKLESKDYQSKRGADAGFDVLPTHTIGISNYRSIAETLEFPVVVRPDRGSLDFSFKAEHINDKDSFLAFMDRRKPDSPDIVAQPFICGPNLVIHGSRSIDGIIGDFHSYIVRIKHQGLAVSLEPFDLPRRIVDSCIYFAEMENLTGVFHFDMVYDEKARQIWFLEANARLGGTTAKVYAAGYDEPRALAESFKIIPPIGSKKVKSKSAVSRFFLLRCLLAAASGKRNKIDYPPPGSGGLFGAAIKAFFTFRDEIISIGQIRFFLSFLSQYRIK